MGTSFKFRYANEVVGTFVIVAAVIIVVTVVAVGRARQWAEPTRSIVVKLPAEGSLGLRPGGEVQILGMPFGVVERIRVDDLGTISAQLQLKGDLIRFVRVDSKAVVKKTLGIAGDAYIEISMGRGLDLPEGTVLEGTSDRAPTQMIDETLVELRREIVPVLRELNQNLQQSRLMLSELRDPGGSAQRTLASAAELTDNLAKGKGLLGRFLASSTTETEWDKVLPQMNQSLSETQKSLETLKGIMADLKRTTETLPQTMASVQTTVDGLPGLLLQIQEMMRQSQRLVEAIQRHWLVNAYVEPSEAGKRIRAEEIGGAP